MRRAALIGIIVLALAAALFAAGGLQDWIARNAIAWQRDAQNALAGALRALRAGQPGAVGGFLALCFAHGFLHALGPGHGKAVIAGYAAASGATLRRLGWIAALSSMAQATVAVGLVYAGVWLLEGARDRVEGLAALIEPASFAVIALLGLLLVRRGLRRLPVAVAHPGAGHAHSDDCACGHAHVPAPRDVARSASWREIAALVAGIALRPCTSALFLLILTWRLDLDAIGILGAYVMGLGTMMVTASAALGAFLFRRGVFLALPEGKTLLPVTVLFELVLGAVIAALGGIMAFRLM